LKIIDLKITKETKNYKYIFVQYTPWLFPNSIKSRHIFIAKKTNDCFWSDTGKRLIASTERAVLAWVEFDEEMLSIGATRVLRTTGGGISTDKRMMR